MKIPKNLVGGGGAGEARPPGELPRESLPSDPEGRDTRKLNFPILEGVFLSRFELQNPLIVSKVDFSTEAERNGVENSN